MLYLFIFRQRGREKEKERNINVWLLLMRPLLGTLFVIQACALTGNGTCDTLVCRLALNPLSHTSQGTNQLFIVFANLQCSKSFNCIPISLLINLNRILFKINTYEELVNYIHHWIEHSNF